jgi:stalled ribosome alternative rescue factor ArfA
MEVEGGLFRKRKENSRRGKGRQEMYEYVRI